MPQLIATLLGAIIIAQIAVGVAHRYEQALKQAVYQNAVLEAARQEATFARAVLAYMSANSPAPTTYITISELQQAGFLSTGFPTENPFNQQARAIVGVNNTAIVTYPFAPSSTYMAELGYQYNGTIPTEALALNEASAISAMQEGVPSLVGGMINGDDFYSPFETIVIPLTTYVPAAYLPTGPIFADVLNIVPQATLSTSSTSAYPAVTGD